MPDDTQVDGYDHYSEPAFSSPEDMPPLPEPEVEGEPIVEGVVPLGYDRGVFFYYSRAARQVVALPAQNHTKAYLKGIASEAHYWQRSIWIGDKGAVKWDDAADHFMGECRRMGIFDPDSLRGRGAWIDQGRSVLHTGDRLIVDGQTSGLMLDGSKFVYEAAKSLSRLVADPLPVREAHKLVDICNRMRWEADVSGVLLAGFIAIAPVCGGLAWRPSIWITGGSGSGKSWIMDNVLAPCLSGIALHVASKTTESGLRQALGSDALPVIFDEAEREDAASAVRIQGVLDLVRMAASESGAEIVKGSQNQSGARRYKIRSSFAFTSINVGIEHQADDSRINVLSLKPAATAPNASDVAKFKTLAADVLTTITPAFAAGLTARSARLLLVIRRNSEIFAEAFAAHAGTRRMGDQIGALLAGAYSLHSDGEISPEDAAAYVQRQKWTAGPVSETADRDEERLLMTLMEHRLRVAPGNGPPIEVTVGRLIVAAWGADQHLPGDVAEAELRANGIRTDSNQGIFVSSTHPSVRRIVTGTPWATRWSTSLSRLPDAEIVKPIRFNPTHVARAVWISRKVVEGGG
jgi:putative DNA primase/helicase